MSSSARTALAAARPVIEDVVWCTMASVGPDGAPRTRIVHPVWDWEAGVGWVTGRGTPLLRRHLAHHPGVSLTYWSPAHSIATLDCTTAWVPAGDKQQVWDRCHAEPGPMGFDPATLFPGGPLDEGFAPVELRPFRIRTHPVTDAAAGLPATLWSVAEPAQRAWTAHGP